MAHPDLEVGTEAFSGPGPMVPLRYRVRSRRDDLDDTVTLELEPVDEPTARPGPGQFNMLWAFGIGEAPISLAGLDGDVLVHTIRRVGAVTAALCAAVPGDEIGVRGPYGVGWDLDRARGRDVVVVAGGLGLAPVRPIVTELVDHRDQFGRVAVLVGARSPDDLLYRDELAEWRSHLDLDVEVTVDTATPSWRGDVGVVTRLIGRNPNEPANTTAFVCGPEVMMRFCALALIDDGTPPDEIFVSMERNMHCAIGHCGHCQLDALFVCKDGPVLSWPTVEPLLRVRER